MTNEQSTGNAYKEFVRVTAEGRVWFEETLNDPARLLAFAKRPGTLAFLNVLTQAGGEDQKLVAKALMAPGFVAELAGSGPYETNRLIGAQPPAERKAILAVPGAELGLALAGMAQATRDLQKIPAARGLSPWW